MTASKLLILLACALGVRGLVLSPPSAEVGLLAEAASPPLECEFMAKALRRVARQEAFALAQAQYQARVAACAELGHGPYHPQIESGVPVGGGVYREPQPAEAEAQRLPQAARVLDHQQPHVSTAPFGILAFVGSLD